jgi:predicted Zn-ribbon and HTH transcriptional regulator
MPPSLTARQRLTQLLANAPHTARELAAALDMPEREVEDHLQHIVKSLHRDQARRFLLHPSGCEECGYLFRDRSRLTRPSRCPRCRSEAITPPRFEIREIESRNR